MYGTAANVKALSGATAESLGFNGDGELNSFIAGRLDAATDYIKRDRQRVFENETNGVPASINDIAERMAANYLRDMMTLRNRSITAVDGEDGQQPSRGEPRYFTTAIKSDLRRIPRGVSLRMWRA